MDKNIISLVLCILVSTSDAAFDKRNPDNEADPKKGAYHVVVTLNDVPRCSGVTITAYAVLTTAKCVSGQPPTSFKIIEGTHRLSQSGNEYEVSYYVKHPLYNDNTNKNNMAVLILKEEIQWRMKHLMVVSSSNTGGRASLTTYGWNISAYLQESMNSKGDRKTETLKIMDKAECSKALEGSSYTLAETEFCAVNKEGNGVCFGEGGNPLVLDYFLFGISTEDVPCGSGYPDVYQRTSHYQSWIYGVIFASPFGQKAKERISQERNKTTEDNDTTAVSR